MDFNQDCQLAKLARWSGGLSYLRVAYDTLRSAGSLTVSGMADAMNIERNSAKRLLTRLVEVRCAEITALGAKRRATFSYIDGSPFPDEKRWRQYIEARDKGPELALDRKVVRITKPNDPRIPKPKPGTELDRCWPAVWYKIDGGAT